MKGYFSVLKIRLLNGIQYRTAAVAGIATQLFWGFMFIMIYEAFYQKGASGAPISSGQIVDYIWLQQSFLIFIILWFRDEDIFNLITSGNIAYEMCKPWDIYCFWYAKLIAQRISGAILRCFPILVIAYLLPEPYGLSLPYSITSFILFTITLFLGVMVLVSISMFIYISVFITMSPTGGMLIFGIVGEFFAGQIIPVPLMPTWLQKIAYILPFRLSSDLPFRIYSGNILFNEAVFSIFVQLFWLAALVITGRMALKKILKNVIVQGG